MPIVTISDTTQWVNLTSVASLTGSLVVTNTGTGTFRISWEER